LYDLYAQEKTTAPARFRIEGTVTGNGNSSGGTGRGGSDIGQERRARQPHRDRVRRNLKI
jgi:hypothetical protein